MSNKKKILRKICFDKGLLQGALMTIVVILGLMVLLPMIVQADEESNPIVVPVDTKYEGLSYGEWSAKWWQWVLSIPADDNPILDKTGKKCDVKQSGNVWFLAGTFGGSANRKCTVPVGKAIFFPIIGGEWSEVEAIAVTPDGDCWIPADFSGTTPNALRACARAQIDEVTELEARIDGMPLQGLENYRVKSKLFTFELPADNILGLDEGDSKSVSDGFWLMLAPLSAGEYTIYFRGVADFTKYDYDFFETEVRYKLIVE